MEKNALIATLTAVYNTLNMVEVRGRENVERMFGVMNALTSTITELRKPEKAPDEAPEQKEE